MKAKEEGHKEATVQAGEDLRLLLSFLRNVSLRRSWAANGQVLDPSEGGAFEAALVAIYEGTDNALAACHKLFCGLDEPVKEGAITCRFFSIRAIIETPYMLFQPAVLRTDFLLRDPTQRTLYKEARGY